MVSDISGPMYLAFFIYTGAGMDIIMLGRNLVAVFMIFGVRSSLIVFSTYVGGKCAGSPPEYYERYWMTFLTQVH